MSASRFNRQHPLEEVRFTTWYVGAEQENDVAKGMQRCPANSMGKEADFAGVVWMGEDGCSDHRPPFHEKSAGRLRIFYDFPLVFSTCAVIIVADKNKEVIIMAVKIEKDTIIGDILDVAPQSAPLFFAIGMHCLGCPSSRGETVEEACMVHGVDCEPFLAQLNNFLEAYEANEAAKQNG